MANVSHNLQLNYLSLCILFFYNVHKIATIFHLIFGKVLDLIKYCIKGYLLVSSHNNLKVIINSPTKFNKKKLCSNIKMKVKFTVKKIHWNVELCLKIYKIILFSKFLFFHHKILFVSCRIYLLIELLLFFLIQFIKLFYRYKFLQKFSFIEEFFRFLISIKFFSHFHFIC